MALTNHFKTLETRLNEYETSTKCTSSLRVWLSNTLISEYMLNIRERVHCFSEHDYENLPNVVEVYKLFSFLLYNLS